MELSERIQEIDDRSKSNKHRLDRCEERLDDQEKLLSTLSGIQTEQKYMRSDLDEIKTDVKALTGKPAAKWDAATKAIVVGVISAIISFIAGKFL